MAGRHRRPALWGIFRCRIDQVIRSPVWELGWAPARGRRSAGQEAPSCACQALVPEVATVRAVLPQAFASCGVAVRPAPSVATPAARTGLAARFRWAGSA
ncbi:hypothetical protein GTS_53630 [Gandjariella thermophila]|uniref:Uncharacterized protein n=1 Tax=Gandjariella thermophila TaxID=1931992 RepID=A0A4D4JFE1_9PSEU|nr:hypothetical protein GTS_53630 [Gandjariella thermophila]